MFMPRPRFHLLLLLYILNSACTSDKREGISSGTTLNSSGTDSLEALQEEPVRNGTIEFQDAFGQFFTVLQAADTAALNRFIHPQLGIWLIEQPGAVPKMTQVNDISAFKREYQERAFFTVAEEMKECDLSEESFPTFDCADMNYEAGETGYSKDGCFVWKPDKFQKSGYWDYANLVPSQIRQIKVTLPLVRRSVLHTNTSFEFHFGFVDQQWRLLFAKLIYPCSA